MTGPLDNDQRKPLRSSMIRLLTLADESVKIFVKKNWQVQRFLRKSKNLVGSKQGKEVKCLQYGG